MKGLIVRLQRHTNLKRNNQQIILDTDSKKREVSSAHFLL